MTRVCVSQYAAVCSIIRRQQHRLLRARADDVRGHDDLASAVRGRLCRIPLDDALAGGHLGAVGVGQVGLEFLSLAVEPGWVRSHELARALRLFAQGVDAGLAFGAFRCFLRAQVLALAQTHNLVGSLAQPAGVVAQLIMGTAALLAVVGGQLDAVDGEHLAPDQAPRVAVIGSSRLWRSWGL